MGEVAASSSSLVELSGPRIYSCCNCRCHISDHDDVISKAFQGRNGRAYLFSHVVNVNVGQREDRHLLTGLHTVADIFCQQCQEVLGWKYERAYEDSQKYKEGKFILEKAKVMKEDWKHKQTLVQFMNRISVDEFAALVRSCKNAEEGKLTHGKLLQTQHKHDRFLANLLIEMYGRFGDPASARSVFDSITDPNVYSWTLITTAYAQNGYLLQAQEFFEAMPQHCTIACNLILAAYAQAGYLDHANDLFEEMSYRDVIAWTTMIAAYAQSGRICEAKRLFETIPCRNTASFNIMIAAHAKEGDLIQAKRLFELTPQTDIVSWNALLTAYTHLGSLADARDLFDSIPLRDIASWTTMIAAYSCAGEVEQARVLFEEMPQHNVISWNALVSANVRKGDITEARLLFNRMQQRDLVSWNTMLAAYAQSGGASDARCLFDEMPQHDVISWNTMIAVYGQKGLLEESRGIFDRMPVRDVVSWNSMLSTYAHNHQGEEALKLFSQMMPPRTEATYASALDACSGSVSLADGRITHATIASDGCLTMVVGNALVNMYGRCGSLSCAVRVFERMLNRNEISWCSMISAYDTNGAFEKAVKLLEMVSVEGVEANDVTFTTILTACSHMGMVEKACRCFVCLVFDYGVEHRVEHYACMVDVFARSGWLEEAEDLLLQMPYVPDLVTWVSLLAACNVQGKSGYGERVVDKVENDQVSKSGAFVLMSNMFRSPKDI